MISKEELKSQYDPSVTRTEIPIGITTIPGDINIIPNTITVSGDINIIPNNINPSLVIGGQQGCFGMDSAVASVWQATPEDKLKELWEGEQDGFDMSLRDFKRLLRMAKENEGLKEILEQAITFFRMCDDGEEDIDYSTFWNNALNTLSSLAQTQYNVHTIPAITTQGPIQGSWIGGLTTTTNTNGSI